MIRTSRMLWVQSLTLVVLASISAVVVSAVPIQLHGLNYNTRKGPDWDWDKCKSRSEIMTDLTLLSRITNRIRILSLRDCGQGELVLSVAKELGMQLWLGLWVAPEDFVFQEEKGELAGLLERGMVDPDLVLGITVGSEAIYREDATVEQMVGYLSEVYELTQNAGLDLPVSIVDIAPEYAASPELRSAVNVTVTNTFPFWEGIPIEGAVDDLQEDLDYILNLPESRSKPFVLGETGWPSDGFIDGVGVAGPELQLRYFEEAFCRIDVENNWAYYWFTGIDNSWRQEQDPENTIEGNWGFLYSDLTLKPLYQDLEFQCSDGVTYSFAEIDWSIPDFTDPPVSAPPESCLANNGCSGLFGNCCPTDLGDYLGCCDNQPTNPPVTTAEPTTPAPTIDTTAPPTSATTSSATEGETAPPTSTPTVTAPISVPTMAPTTLATTLQPSPVPTTDAPTFEPTPKATSNASTSPSKSPTLGPSMAVTSAPVEAAGAATETPTTAMPVMEPTPRPTVLTVSRPVPTNAPVATQDPQSTSINGILDNSSAVMNRMGLAGTTIAAGLFLVLTL